MSADIRPAEAFQIPVEAARTYEATFVPAFFTQWAGSLCEAAGVRVGTRVLDVACGTGIVSRTAAGITGAQHVVGVDLNEAMLTVAREIRPDIEWRQGDAAALPFADESFDAVVCQMALMFFPDRLGAVREMARVAAPGGRVAVLVPSVLDWQPAYGPFVEMASRYAGGDVQALLGTYFSCGDVDALRRLFDDAGLTVTTATVQHGAARFPSIDALVDAEVRSTPLADRLTEATFEQIRVGARDVLARFTDHTGRITAPFESLLVVGTPRRPQ